MSAGRKGAEGSGAGGPIPHVPVLLAEVIEALEPGAGQVIVDGTFGAGGYSRALLERGAEVIGFDRDPDAIKAGAALVAASGGRLGLVEAPFSRMEEELSGLGIRAADAIVLDIGVSSMQIDQAARGFSFQGDGPLDMRMAQAGLSAADVVNDWSAEDLANVIFAYGEERKSRAIARAIVAARDETAITTTGQLAAIIEKAIGRGRPDAIHPATRSFQALRIFVNDELNELVEVLGAAERLLRPGGRLVVVTFHSLEDRIVKRFLQERSAEVAGGSRHAPATDLPSPTFRLPGRKPVTAGAGELAINPRARSAKLRVASRTREGARELDAHALGLPRFSRGSSGRGR